MISFNDISSDLVASKVALEVSSQVSAIAGAIIPQKMLIIGQYDVAKTVTDYVPFELTSGLQEAKNKYGNGSMISLMVAKAMKTAGTTIPIYVAPVPEDGAGVAAEGTITIVGTVTTAGVLYFYVAGQRVAVSTLLTEDETAVAVKIKNAINAITDLPVTADNTAGVVTLTAKWKGLTGNDITIKENLGGISESNAAPVGITVAIVAMSSGATNPDKMEEVFAQLGGSDWFTVIANPFQDATNLTAFEAGLLELSGNLVKQWSNGFTGTTLVLASAQSLADGRNSQFNTIVPVDSSPMLPCEIAASAAGVVAKSAQSDPSRPFKNLILTDILPGNKWTYSQIDASEKVGLATTDVTADNRVKIYDLVTTYKTNPQGAVDTSYRYTSTISNLQAKIYSMNRLLESSPFDRAKIIDDNTVTSQEYAISPKVLKGYIIQLIDKVWIANVWSKNRDDIVESIQVEINTNNPSRMDISYTDIIAVGARIFAVKHGFAFTPAE